MPSRCYNTFAANTFAAYSLVSSFLGRAHLWLELRNCGLTRWPDDHTHSGLVVCCEDAASANRGQAGAGGQGDRDTEDTANEDKPESPEAASATKAKAETDFVELKGSTSREL